MTSAPTREYLGRLCRQSFFRRSFDIDDKDGDCVLVMKDNKHTFQIMTPQGLEVGHADLESNHSKVTTQQLLPEKQCRFQLSFPQEMDVRIKAVLLGSILAM